MVILGAFNFKNFQNRWTFCGKFLENPKFWNETRTIQPKIPGRKIRDSGNKLSEIASEYSFPETVDNAVPFANWNFWECRMKSAYYPFPVVGVALNVYVALRLTNQLFVDRKFWYGRVHCSCYYRSFDLFSISLWLGRAYLYNPRIIGCVVIVDYCQFCWRHPSVSSCAVSMVTVHDMAAVCSLWPVCWWRWGSWRLFMASRPLLSSSGLCSLHFISLTTFKMR